MDTDTVRAYRKIKSFTDAPPTKKNAELVLSTISERLF